MDNFMENQLCTKTFMTTWPKNSILSNTGKNVECCILVHYLQSISEVPDPPTVAIAMCDDNDLVTSL